MKPLWLLDVDGVINAIDPAHDGKPGWNTSKCGFIIRWRTKVIDFINRIDTEGLAEIKWLTTWQDLANVRLVEPLGLPRFELAGVREYEVGSLDWWKFDIVRNTVADDVPLIWTDDDIQSALYTVHGMRKWAGGRAESRTLLISPKWRHGLSDSALDAIEQFVKRHA